MEEVSFNQRLQRTLLSNGVHGKCLTKSTGSENLRRGIDGYWERFERNGIKPQWNLKEGNMKSKIFCLLAGVLMMVSGCMTFNEKMLKTTDIPKQQNPTFLIETKFGELVQRHNGTPNRGVLSGTTVLKAVSKSMMGRWKSKGLISNYAVSGDLKQEPDFTLTLSGVRDEESSILLAVLCGLTLLVIPSNATLIYNLDVDLVDNKTQKGYSVKVKNGITTWTEIIFLPFLPIFWVGSHNAMNDMADYAYEELRKQGAFQR